LESPGRSEHYVDVAIDRDIGKHLSHDPRPIEEIGRALRHPALVQDARLRRQRLSVSHSSGKVAAH
jgi:hypothetical protein